MDGFSPVIEPDIGFIPDPIRRYYKLRDSFVMPEGDMRIVDVALIDLYAQYSQERPK